MARVSVCDALNDAASAAPSLFIELGPGQTLTGFARRTRSDAEALSILGPAASPGSDVASVLHLLGRLWTRGVAPDWGAFAVGRRRRIPMPTYPFERRRFWIDPAPTESQTGADVAGEKPKVNTGVQNERARDVDDLIDQQLDVIAAQLALLKGR
jgi:acyl transferase domain-containing protein